MGTLSPPGPVFCLTRIVLEELPDSLQYRSSIRREDPTYPETHEAKDEDSSDDPPVGGFNLVRHRLDSTDHFGQGVSDRESTEDASETIPELARSLDGREVHVGEWKGRLEDAEDRGCFCSGLRYDDSLGPNLVGYLFGWRARPHSEIKVRS